MRCGLATLFLGVSLALAYDFPGKSVTRAVRASTPTSTTWSFELPEDLAPIKRSTLRAQLSSAVNRHHTSWASAVDIHGLPGGDRPADGLLRPCARPNRDQIRPRDHEIDICITPQVDDTDGAIDLDVARVNHREFGQDLLIGGKELVLISQTSPPDLHKSSKSSQTRMFTTSVPNNNDPFGRCAEELLYYIGLMALDSPMSKAIASQPSLSGTSTRPHLGVSTVDLSLPPPEYPSRWRPSSCRSRYVSPLPRSVRAHPRSCRLLARGNQQGAGRFGCPTHVGHGPAKQHACQLQLDALPLCFRR